MPFEVWCDPICGSFPKMRIFGVKLFVINFAIHFSSILFLNFISSILKKNYKFLSSLREIMKYHHKCRTIPPTLSPTIIFLHATTHPSWTHPYLHSFTKLWQRDYYAELNFMIFPVPHVLHLQFSEILHKSVESRVSQSLINARKSSLKTSQCSHTKIRYSKKCWE